MTTVKTARKLSNIRYSISYKSTVTVVIVSKKITLPSKMGGVTWALEIGWLMPHTIRSCLVA